MKNPQRKKKNYGGKEKKPPPTAGINMSNCTLSVGRSKLYDAHYFTVLPMRAVKTKTQSSFNFSILGIFRNVIGERRVLKTLFIDMHRIQRHQFPFQFRVCMAYVPRVQSLTRWLLCWLGSKASRFESKSIRKQEPSCFYSNEFSSKQFSLPLFHFQCFSLNENWSLIINSTMLEI